MKLSLPNGFTQPDGTPPPDELPRQRRKRRTDAEREPRRAELGSWSRGRTA